VSAINQVGHVLGIQTIAEFVENDAILARLRDLGVDYAQGYGIGKPEPMPEPGPESASLQTGAGLSTSR
ncbi:MAG: EAL domain-containing protein, partial [Enhygromyxa sp.]